MKNLTLLLFATLLSITAMAQQPKKVYCAIWGSETTSFEGYVYIDYGQDDDRQNYLVNSEGKGIKYNSLVQAANYLAEYGWELTEIYNQPRRWILSKEVSSDEEITEGIYTKYMHKNR